VILPQPAGICPLVVAPYGVAIYPVSGAVDGLRIGAHTMGRQVI
jgi:hypothetical protein